MDGVHAMQTKMGLVKSILYIDGQMHVHCSCKSGSKSKSSLFQQFELLSVTLNFKQEVVAGIAGENELCGVCGRQVDVRLSGGTSVTHRHVLLVH